jgi:2-polyprenyl-3-methyl-5-hydroxy-6-metoxy-1,4-benzoquinol methylase
MTTAIAGSSVACPHLEAFLAILARTAPLQRRAVDVRLKECGPQFFTDAERFFADFTRVLDATRTDLADAVASYVSICKETFTEQVKFARTGRYSAATVQEAHATIQSHEAMTRYMLGLAITQYLWLQHYETLNFFRQFIAERRAGGRYLEIGPGHGLYLLEALRVLKGTAFAAVDISQASIDIARNLVSQLSSDAKGVAFHVRDIFAWTPEAPFDTVTMGEVLEHVEDPLALLRRAAGFVKPEGRLFVTTCANCPAIDHVYLFRSVTEIQELVAAAGCAIVDEHITTRDYGIKRRDGTVVPTTQYAAILRKAA